MIPTKFEFIKSELCCFRNVRERSYIVMTSVDSGIETSNNSDDCSINQDGEETINNDSSHLTISDDTMNAEGNTPPLVMSGLHISPVDKCFLFGCYQLPGSQCITINPDLMKKWSSSKTSSIIKRKERAEANNYKKKRSLLERLKRSHPFPIFDISKGCMMRFAALTNNTEYIKRQLHYCDAPDIRGRTPLHIAASRGYTEIVSLLLAHGADPNLRDHMGNTPLHLAAAANKMSMVMLLLKAGADASCLNSEGNSSLKLAQIKLSLLQNCADTEISKIKEEVQSIINMLVTCLQKEKDVEADKKIETLANFYSRLSLSNTTNQVQSDVKDLLASLNNLSVGSKSD